MYIYPYRKSLVISCRYSFKMSRYSIFGDSYVIRLRHSEYAVLRLGDTPVYYFGQRRLRLENILGHDDWRRMLAFGPTDVFFHYGGNSFTANTTPEKVFNKLTSIVDNSETVSTTCCFQSTADDAFRFISSRCSNNPTGLCPRFMHGRKST